MEAFVLIMTLVIGGSEDMGSVSTAEFSSLNKCVVAGDAWVAGINLGGVTDQNKSFYFCSEK